MSTTLNFPKSNPIRMVIREWVNRNPKNVDHLFFKEVSLPSRDIYFQPWQQNDPIYFHFDSSFDENTVVLKVYRDGTEEIGDQISDPIQWRDGTLAYWRDNDLKEWVGATGNSTIISDEGTYKKREVQLFLNEVPEGKYYLEASGSHSDGRTYLAQSEPIEVKADHENSTKLMYWNAEPLGGIDFRSGVVMTMRVKGKFAAEVGVNENESVRNALREAFNIYSATDEARELVMLTCPIWQVDKVNRIADHDFVSIDDIQVVFDERIEMIPQSKEQLWVRVPRVVVPLQDASQVNRHYSTERILY
jgi:hypothetical protein